MNSNSKQEGSYSSRTNHQGSSVSTSRKLREYRRGYYTQYLFLDFAAGRHHVIRKAYGLWGYIRLSLNWVLFLTSCANLSQSLHFGDYFVFYKMGTKTEPTSELLEALNVYSAWLNSNYYYECWYQKLLGITQKGDPFYSSGFSHI